MDILKVVKFLLRVKLIILYYKCFFRIFLICGFDIFFFIIVGSIISEYNVIVFFRVECKELN